LPQVQTCVRNRHPSVETASDAEAFGCEVKSPAVATPGPSAFIDLSKFGKREPMPILARRIRHGGLQGAEVVGIRVNAEVEAVFDRLTVGMEVVEKRSHALQLTGPDARRNAGRLFRLMRRACVGKALDSLRIYKHQTNLVTRIPKSVKLRDNKLVFACRNDAGNLLKYFACEQLNFARRTVPGSVRFFPLPTNRAPGLARGRRNGSPAAQARKPQARRLTTAADRARRGQVTCPQEKPVDSPWRGP
jgi:hypothetical protein